MTGILLLRLSPAASFLNFSPLLSNHPFNPPNLFGISRLLPNHPPNPTCIWPLLSSPLSTQVSPNIFFPEASSTYWFFLNNTPPPAPPSSSGFFRFSVFYHKSPIWHTKMISRSFLMSNTDWVNWRTQISTLVFIVVRGSLSSGTFLYIIPSLFFLFYALTGAQSLSLAPDAWK